MTASGFQLIGKETERGWEQSEDVSTLLPSLIRYQHRGIADGQLRQRLLRIPLDVLERETGLSRHTILRARRGQHIQPRSLQRLRRAIQAVINPVNPLRAFASVFTAEQRPDDA